MRKNSRIRRFSIQTWAYAVNLERVDLDEDARYDVKPIRDDNIQLLRRRKGPHTDLGTQQAILLRYFAVLAEQDTKDPYNRPVKLLLVLVTVPATRQAIHS